MSTPAPASSAPPSGRRLKFAALGLLLLGVSGAIALGLGELLVRMAAPQQLIQIRPDLWQPADTVGWRLRPDVSVHINTGERTVSVHTDRDGYRVGAAGRREAASRVLLIGDSFVEALQVEYEQTFGHLLETELSRRIGSPVAVRNAGVSDWSPNHYLLRTRQLLARDTFDLVLVGVFVGNDAVRERRDHVPPRVPVERSRLRWPRRFAGREIVEAWLRPVNDALETRSHLFVLLKNQFAGLRMRLGMTAEYFPSEFRREQATTQRWQVTGRLASDLRAEAEARGIPTLFVLIPERLQVYEEDFRRLVRGFGVDSTSVDVDQPSRLLFTAFEAEGLRVIDALPTFREAAKGRPKLFGTVDQHLSEEGHRVLADLLAPRVAPLLVSR